MGKPRFLGGSVAAERLIISRTYVRMYNLMSRILVLSALRKCKSLSKCECPLRVELDSLTTDADRREVQRETGKERKRKIDAKCCCILLLNRVVFSYAAFYIFLPRCVSPTSLKHRDLRQKDDRS